MGTETPVRDGYEKTRVLYIIEAALEYFIDTLIGGAYLANITRALGMSDALTGVVTAFTSLGAGFQCVALFLSNRTPVKRWVSLLHLLNQLCFTFVYAIPILPVSENGKIVLFIVFLFSGKVIVNIISSPKINWFMTCVPDGRRGRFTANKEIVSLLSGVVFTFLMGRMIDGFRDAGRMEDAFLWSGVTIFGLTILHTLTLVFSKEKPTVVKKTTVGRSIKELLTDKRFLAVTGVSVLWNVTTYASTPFYGSYQTGALDAGGLGFTMTFIAALGFVGSVARSLVSRPLGRYADKTSFTRMMTLCFCLEAVAYICAMCAVPGNGQIFYSAYSICHALGMGGINSGAINLIYDYVTPDKRVGALAVKNTLAGFIGFFTTLAVSPLVAKIQDDGNTFLGLHLYAPQVVSGIGLVMVLVILLYLRTVISKIQRVTNDSTVSASSQTDDETAGCSENNR